MTHILIPHLKLLVLYVLLQLIRIHQVLGKFIYIEDYGGVPDSKWIQDIQEPFITDSFFSGVLQGNVSSIYPEFRPQVSEPDRKPLSSSLSSVWNPSRPLSTHNNSQVIAISRINTQAFNDALRYAFSGDHVILRDGESYTFIGGIHGQYLHNITIDFAGMAHFIYNRDVWPYDHKKQEFVPAFGIFDSTQITITSSASLTNRAHVMVNYDKNDIFLDPKSGFGGIIDGMGRPWWDDSILGLVDDDSRPRLCVVNSSMDVLVENITLINSPFWSLTVEAIRAEMRFINVLIDRMYQRRIKEESHRLHERQSTVNEQRIEEAVARQLPNQIPDIVSTKDTSTLISTKGQKRKTWDLDHFHFPDLLPKWILQPQDLNTDGIDPIGRDIWIHDCIVLNDDDSVAVKPPYNGIHSSVLNHTISYNCTQNITIENMVLTGFGASVGSVGPSWEHTCVDNILFRNIRMPGTGKGIYIKSNADDCRDNKTSLISNIRYQMIHIKQPIWWPIWIGPQAQHEPHEILGDKCPLNYPIGDRPCPTQACATFENITIEDVLIDDPILSPGVLLGNVSNPMKNVIFENVTVSIPRRNSFHHGRLPFHESSFPFRGKYNCENVVGTCRKCDPAPDCLTVLE